MASLWFLSLWSLWLIQPPIFFQRPSGLPRGLMQGWPPLLNLRWSAVALAKTVGLRYEKPLAHSFTRPSGLP
jgi:hypothetical protein